MKAIIFRCDPVPYSRFSGEAGAAAFARILVILPIESCRGQAALLHGLSKGPARRVLLGKTLNYSITKP